MNGLQLSAAIVVEPDGEGYHAYCPAFKGLHAGGETEEKAFEGAREAAIMYLESIVRHGDPIPVGPDCETTRSGKSVAIPPTATVRPLELSWPIPERSAVSEKD